jgi:transcriptional regulator with XRE-family HTH domain
MGIPIDDQALRQELARRGLTGDQFARLAQVTPATVSHALNHHRVGLGTVRRFARALTLAPVLPGVDAFVPTRDPTAPS